MKKKMKKNWVYNVLTKHRFYVKLMTIKKTMI